MAVRAGRGRARVSDDAALVSLFGMSGIVTDLLGYAASIAVPATFLMPTMLPLRLVAIMSNVLFVMYGCAAHIRPVMFLHISLLPINVARLLTMRDCGTAWHRLDASLVRDRRLISDDSVPSA
jgi:hypothetical protein